ncbi:MAG: FecR protein [Deltaproteobacteria bacterium]|nr:FecR protein [Deltaproteobacteria bacterium]
MIDPKPGSPRIDLSRAVPDPTPPPGARARVRAGIAGRVERARRHRVWSGYAAIFAAAAIAVALMSLSRSDPPGSATIVGAPLGAGVIELPSGARVLVRAETTVHLVRDDGAGTILRVERGTILAHVAKRAPGHPFVVLAGAVRVEVVGTVFSVDVALDGTVGVRGYEGTVRVIGPGIETRVTAGQTWPTAAAAPMLDGAALTAVGVVPPVAPAPPPPAAPSPPPVAVDPAPPPTIRTAPAPAIRPNAYVSAKRLEEAGELARALAAYEAIRSGPEAEDALYAVGRLQESARHDPGAALAVFTAYRKAYPAGRYARAVDLHILDLAIARRDFDTVEREANWFLVEHAADPLAARFLLARASARIHRGDCTAALADLAKLPPSKLTAALGASCGR